MTAITLTCSECGETNEVNPDEVIVLVCPACHAVVR